MAPTLTPQKLKWEAMVTVAIWLRSPHSAVGCGEGQCEGGGFIGSVGSDKCEGGDLLKGDSDVTVAGGTDGSMPWRYNENLPLP